MPLSFLINNRSLQLVDGLPGNYDSNVVKGIKSHHRKTGFGLVVVQEIETPLACFRILHFRYERPAAIVCRYKYDEPVLHVRTVLNHPAYELIKGSGLQHFKEKEYAWLS